MEILSYFYHGLLEEIDFHHCVKVYIFYPGIRLNISHSTFLHCQVVNDLTKQYCMYWKPLNHLNRYSNYIVFVGLYFHSVGILNGYYIKLYCENGAKIF